ncbi:MAG: YitT family protein [Ruminococcaceae bacterium]|nr:YitT family protein [Oscillospiraceae bacterium]
MRKKNILEKFDRMFFADYLIIFFGCILYALSVVLFTSPNNIAPGGVIGVSTMLNYVFPFLPIGTMTLVLNIPIFLWGGFALGWKYLGRSVLGSAVSSVLMDFFNILIDNGVMSYYHGDGMLVCIFGGLLCGVGLALIFYRGGSTGGTDIISRIMHEKMPHVSMGNFILLIDALVVTSSAFVYGNIENALYAAICIFMNSKLIDTVLYGVSRNNGKLLFIVTSKYDAVTDAILSKIDRGVTLLNAEGGYQRDEKRVLLCAVRPQQVHRTNLLVHEIDPNAFVIITTANAIKGRGFYSYDEAPNPPVYGDKDLSANEKKVDN